MVRAYTGEKTYTYKWCSSPEEQVSVAAEYARAGYHPRPYSARTRPYIRITLVDYVTDDAGQRSESERLAYRRAAQWPDERSEAATA
jgi:hypothetical protein